MIAVRNGPDVVEAIYRGTDLLWSCDVEALFGLGSGVLIDPSLPGMLYQDAAGSTPVSAVGQPVGRVLDLGGDGRHLVQTVSAARPTYRVDAAGRSYLEYDGVDDWLATEAFGWGSDEVTIIAAMRKRTDEVTTPVAEFGPNSLATDGTFGLMPIGGSQGYRFRLRGTLVSEANLLAGYPAGGNHVVTAAGKIASDQNIMRVNGVPVRTSTADQGTGVFGTQRLFIGRRDGSSVYTAMDLYWMIAVNRLLTPFELSLAEGWAAAKLGVTL